MQVLVDYLLNITRKIFFIEVQGNPGLNGKRMASALAIICCIRKNRINIELNDASALLEMLRLMPDVQSSKCIDWEYVNELIPKKFKASVAEYVRTMANSLCQKKHFSLPEWLYAMPVLHFLCGVSSPFQEVLLSSTEIPWGSKLIELGKVKSHTYEHDG